MRLELENIGMLKKADVSLNGLTVIAGENDTGKSTVGKILFCIIKAISRYKEDFQESKEYKINNILERLFFLIRKHGNIEEHNMDTLDNLLSLDYYNSRKNSKQYIDAIHKNIEQYTKFSNNTTEPSLVNILIHKLEDIISQPENKQKSIENALTKVFRSEFDANILSHHKKAGYIKLYENDLLLLDVKIDNNNNVLLQNDAEPIELNEATFIETPLILNSHDLLIRSQTGLDITKRRSRILGVPYTTLHTKDLFDKLKLYNFSFDFDELFESDIIHDISNIIGGEIIYDVEEKDFVYIKSDHRVPIKNTASGIKSFGLIQLLIDNGFVNRTSIVILDEPEIHLHPKWQVEYAKIISILAKYDIPILVTSHSPYMIEALKRYSDKYDIEHKTSFQLAVGNTIENKTNLTEIFKILSEPFETFRQMDAKELADD